MKFDKEVHRLEKAISKSDFVEARRIVELNLDKFKETSVRVHLKLDVLDFINTVLMLNETEYEATFSRETLLIIQHINKLAYDGDFNALKRYCSLHEKILSNPKIYNLLNDNTKFLIPAPKVGSIL